MTAENDDDPARMRTVARLAAALTARDARLVTAESCTGGLIAAACTARAGSSTWFERGYVTYSNAAKQADLGVPAAVLAEHGAVSAPVVAAMTAGALAAAPEAHWAIAVSGVAGPDGGSPDKPVGTVYIGWQARGAAADVARYGFDGDRAAVRRASVDTALRGLCERLAVG